MISSDILQKSNITPNDINSVKKLMASAESPYILLSVSYTATSCRPGVRYLLFSVSDLSSNNDGSNNLPYTLLPAELTSSIREPLAMLAGGCFAFLAVDGWVCTICLTSLKGGWLQEAHNSGLRKNAIKKHYFLPCDWVTTNEAHLCTITPDGILLAPKNGEVVAVESVELRKEILKYRV